VRDYIKNAEEFRTAKSHVVLVYPGKPEDTDPRSAEFFSDKKLPDNFTLLLDPGYEFTNLYGLRWDAPNETAYPSTFLIDSNRRVFFSRVSTTHGGRTKASEILEALAKP